MSQDGRCWVGVREEEGDAANQRRICFSLNSGTRKEHTSSPQDTGAPDTHSSVGAASVICSGPRLSAGSL